MSGQLYGAVDIGGTKTSVALFDRDLKLLSEQTFPTCGYTCRELVSHCRDVMQQQCEALGISISLSDINAIGIACPGPLDLHSGTVVHIPTLGWRKEPLKRYFEQEFGQRVALQNDTNAAALGEYVFGGGRGNSVVVYITVSTGVGCGIVINGRIFDGASDAAGELGHMKMIKDGRLCDCGGRGCLEAYASGKSIAVIASEMIGRTVQAKEIFQMAREGNTKMTSIITRAAEMLGLAISSLYQILDPAVVIIGGSVTRDFDFFGPLLIKTAENSVQSHPLRKISIVKSELDGRQVLIGAACLAKE